MSEFDNNDENENLVEDLDTVADEDFKEVISGKSIAVFSYSQQVRNTLAGYLRSCMPGPRRVWLLKSPSDFDELQSENFDLIICDTDFPVNNTLENKKKLLEKCSPISTVLVVICSEINNEYINTALDTQVAAYIPKPYTIDHVKRACCSTLRGLDHSGNYDKLLENGLTLYSNKETQKALDIFGSIEQKFANPYMASFYLGYIHSKSNDVDEAKNCFMKSIEYNPTFYPSYIFLFEALYDAKRLEESDEIVNMMNARFPLNYSLIQKLTYISLQLKKIDQLLHVLDQYTNVTGSTRSSDKEISQLIIERMSSNELQMPKQETKRVLDMNFMFCIRSMLLEEFEQTAVLYIQNFSELTDLQLLDSFSIRLKRNEHFAIVELLVANHYKGLEHAAKKAVNLLRTGTEHPVAYKFALSYKVKPEQAGTILKMHKTACKKYPEFKDTFDAILAQNQNLAA